MNIIIDLFVLNIAGISLLYLSRRHSFHAVGESASLDDVARLLVRTHCHRVAVVNDAGEVVKVISQSSLIKYVYKC